MNHLTFVITAFFSLYITLKTTKWRPVWAALEHSCSATWGKKKNWDCYHDYITSLWPKHAKHQFKSLVDFLLVKLADLWRVYRLIMRHWNLNTLTYLLRSVSHKKKLLPAVFALAMIQIWSFSIVSPVKLHGRRVWPSFRSQVSRTQWHGAIGDSYRSTGPVMSSVSEQAALSDIVHSSSPSI